MVTEGASAFWMEPGVYSGAQVAGWRQVTDAVHAAGGRIVLQLWHGGRACHPLLNGRTPAVAPSALAIRNDSTHTPEGKQAYTVPRPLHDNEIPGIVSAFARAAANAMRAGFDGVEVHGAKGYLSDQFLRDGTNRRSGPYGGPRENRARLLFEVLEAVGREVGSGRVGLRLSPLNSFNDMVDSDPVGLAGWLAGELNRFSLAYLHLMRADFLGRQSGDLLTPVREAFAGALVGNMGYTPDEASLAVAAGQLDAVAFGSAYLANPDLAERIRQRAPLNAADPATFYTPGPAGYTDYPALDAAMS